MPSGGFIIGLVLVAVFAGIIAAIVGMFLAAIAACDDLHKRARQDLEARRDELERRK